jgi:hypothetical protein
VPFKTRSVRAKATCSVAEPVGPPGKTRARFFPSSGLQRVLVAQAAGFAIAIARTVPAIGRSRSTETTRRTLRTPSSSSP